MFDPDPSFSYHSLFDVPQHLSQRRTSLPFLILMPSACVTSVPAVTPSSIPDVPAYTPISIPLSLPLPADLLSLFQPLCKSFCCTYLFCVRFLALAGKLISTICMIAGVHLSVHYAPTLQHRMSHSLPCLRTKKSVLDSFNIHAPYHTFLNTLAGKSKNTQSRGRGKYHHYSL